MTTTLAALLFATTACTSCTPAANEPGTSGGKSSGEPTARQRKELEPPPPEQMVREAKGVDITKLSETQQSTFFTMINTEPSACDKPHSLATSLREDGECRDSLLVAQFISDRLADGATPSDIKLEIDPLVDSLTVRDIPIDGRPTYGNERAPVTVVVFADFQCPHCKLEAPGLRKAVQQYRGQAKLVFKHFPLSSMHTRAEAAARATEAAHMQGKFWEMHDLVFDHQTQLEDADLERYAKQIPDLDFAKWKADYASEATQLAVAKDRAHGDLLQIAGTPAVYVDGRLVTPLLWGGNLTSWIEDALRR
ncbi:DsbA family protein [Nannocystaceae bacterium ST9]